MSVDSHAPNACGKVREVSPHGLIAGWDLALVSWLEGEIEAPVVDAPDPVIDPIQC